MTLRRRLVLLPLVAVALAAPAAAAPPPPLQCLPNASSPASTLRGPCEFLDSVNVVFGSSDADVTLVANFGLLRREAPGALHYTCEEALGGLAIRSRRAKDGAWLVGTVAGILRHEPATCSDSPQQVALDGSDVVDILVPSNGDPRIWALTANPAALHRSDDGGRSFTRRFTFPAGEQPLKLGFFTPSGETILFVAGEDARGRLLLRRSGDGGESFAAPAGEPPPGIPRELLGVEPGVSGLVFAVVRAATGTGEHDEVWRAADAGRVWQRVLVLPDSEAAGGFAFGPGNTIYLGVREVLFGAAGAPARLLVSRDSGDTWDAPIPSPRNGPRFRCLAVQGGRLYACAGGEPNGDDFLLGVSDDGGHRWTPVMTAGELAGPEPCLRATCLPTSEWLCSTYGLCEGRPDSGAPADASTSTDAATTVGHDGGCGCTVGAAPRPAPAAALVIMLAAALIRRTLRTVRDGKSPPVPRARA